MHGWKVSVFRWNIIHFEEGTLKKCLALTRERFSQFFNWCYLPTDFTNQISCAPLARQEALIPIQVEKCERVKRVDKAMTAFFHARNHYIITSHHITHINTWRWYIVDNWTLILYEFDWTFAFLSEWNEVLKDDQRRFFVPNALDCEWLGLNDLPLLKSFCSK